MITPLQFGKSTYTVSDFLKQKYSSAEVQQLDRAAFENIAVLDPYDLKLTFNTRSDVLSGTHTVDVQALTQDGLKDVTVLRRTRENIFGAVPLLVVSACLSPFDAKMRSAFKDGLKGVFTRTESMTEFVVRAFNEIKDKLEAAQKK